MSLPSLLRFVWNHPLNDSARGPALLRVLRWQLASRLAGAPIAMPYVDDTRLLMTRGMTGATGNWYCGLQEYEEMGFLLHFLRPGDLFMDVGANVGSYTVLAAAAGAEVVAFEPVPSTFRWLEDNVRLNRLEDRVSARNLGLSRAAGRLAFTAGLDTVNHVLRPGEEAEAVEVAVSTLDAELSGRAPAALKIDVEGFELPVLDGGDATLASPSLKAVILETNGSGEGYGVQDAALFARMAGHGFEALRYDPARRQLAAPDPRAGNTLFVRDRSFVEGRLPMAREFKLVNGKI
ncbi:MAG: FkbM family methyltransferase [Holophagaceae bacterium]